jgi:hypothetical protein
MLYDVTRSRQQIEFSTWMESLELSKFPRLCVTSARRSESIEVYLLPWEAASWLHKCCNLEAAPPVVAVEIFANAQ